MTLEDLRYMNCEVLTPEIVAKIIKCDPHWIRITARNNPSRLGFPVILIGNRVKIPRLAFIQRMEGKQNGT